ncbi:MAG: maltodextrin glucosidase, partial [Pseudobutyrivibrio sp.]|nr:maltodextrin glucosidase [Pseudobutyrivibrio sp.]
MENNISWAKEAVFYHIYPIGAFGCHRENDRGEVRHNILKVMDYIPHLKDMGITAVYFGP